jgi:hypothetical protein
MLKFFTITVQQCSLFFHYFTAAAEASYKKHQLSLSGSVCSKRWEAGYVGMGMELFMCDSGTFFPLCLQKFNQTLFENEQNILH